MAELYKAYRPLKFDEIVGQEMAVAKVEGFVKKKPASRPRAYLFAGPRGTGKTTLARIFVNQLGIAPEDFAEVDSAQFRGVDTVRDIRRNMQLAPRAGSAMAWLLDEVHQMTPVAQDAMLKALEDGPDHVYFLLATTEPNKLISTVRSRCHLIETHELAEDELRELVLEIAEAEKVSLPDKVAKQIAVDALGSARDALVILEDIIALPPAKMLAAAKRSAEKQNEAIELCRLMQRKASWTKVSKLLQGLQHEDPEGMRRLMLKYATSVLLKSDDPRAFLIIDGFSEPFYNSGFAGLVGACYAVTTS